MGRLSVVATPIGNLGDLTPRAVQVLAAADLVLAEDTRRTATLLRHAGVDTPMRPHHAHNAARSTSDALAELDAGAHLVLVSDAGTPLVSDPGQRLVAAAAAAGHEVVAVPGPSAVLHALVVAGLPAERFTFEGFLPRRRAARRTRLAEVAAEARTSVWFVAPHHAAADLADLAAAAGPQRPAALCRELTKLHEEVLRAPLGELAERCARAAPRGELTLVLAGAPPPPVTRPDDAELVAMVRAREAAGQRRKDAISEVARDAQLPKREVFDAVVADKHR